MGVTPNHQGSVSMNRAGETSPWMCYEVLLDPQRIQQLLTQFAADPAGVAVSHAALAEPVPAQLRSERDEWILQLRQPPFPPWAASSSDIQLTLSQGGQRLQTSCHRVSQGGQFLHLDLPDCVRYAQLRRESRVSLEQGTGVHLTLQFDPTMPISAEPFDLSEGGLGALLPLEMPLRSSELLCPVILQLPGGMVETAVDIRFLAPCPATSSWRMGARFDQLDVEQRSLIRGFLMDRQREMRRSLTPPRVPAN
jgi:hypothetical protein